MAVIVRYRIYNSIVICMQKAGSWACTAPVVGIYDTSFVSDRILPGCVYMHGNYYFSMTLLTVNSEMYVASIYMSFGLF